MKAYPDPNEFFAQHMEQAAEKRIQGMKRAGIIQPSQKLVNRLIERDVEAGQQRYMEESDKIFRHNMKLLKKDIFRARLRQTRQEVCPLLIIMYALTALLCFVVVHYIVLAVIASTLSLSFLLWFIWGAIFDKRTGEE